jgi:citrate lyase subunit beta/citryl-CoA lyase
VISDTAVDALLRTLLFVPGSDRGKLNKVGRFGSDAVVLDLEDAVAEDRKTEAREFVREAVPSYGDGQVVMVRVNGHTGGRMCDDIAAVVVPGLNAVMVPKVEDARELAAADAALAEAEHAAGMPTGRVRLIPLIETPRGIARCEAVAEAAPQRTLTLAFGSGDFATALGVELSADGLALDYARGRLVVAARAAGLAHPLDGPYLDLRDLNGLKRDCERSRQLGYQGRVIVYPPQVPVAQRAYSAVSGAAVEHARHVVEAFEAAEAHGIVSINVDGRFVDYPIYRLAQERLRSHEAYRRTVEATG